jgi:hypothetical protein
MHLVALWARCFLIEAWLRKDDLFVLACRSKDPARLRIIISLARVVCALLAHAVCVFEMAVIAFPKPRFVHVGNTKGVIRRNSDVNL